MIDRPEWWLMGLSGRLYQVSFSNLELILYCDGCIQYHALKYLPDIVAYACFEDVFNGFML